MARRETVEFARIVAFTDGVFAIAITLLVLTIEVPADLGAAELHEYLLDSWRQFFAYFLSFAVVGRFWLAHHRMFALLDGFDHTLLVLNLAYLALVVLAPFPTDLLGTYGDGTDAVVLYAVLLGSIALLGWIMLRYCLRHDFVQRGARTQAEAMAPAAIAAATVFYASIPVALVSPAAGQLVWLGLVLYGLRRRARVVPVPHRPGPSEPPAHA